MTRKDGLFLGYVMDEELIAEFNLASSRVIENLMDEAHFMFDKERFLPVPNKIRNLIFRHFTLPLIKEFKGTPNEKNAAKLTFIKAHELYPELRKYVIDIRLKNGFDHRL